MLFFYKGVKKGPGAVRVRWASEPRRDGGFILEI